MSQPMTDPTDARVGEGMGKGERQSMKEAFNREREWRIAAEAERDEAYEVRDGCVRAVESHIAALAAAEQALRERTSALERAEGHIKSAVWDFTHGVPADLIFLALSDYTPTLAPQQTGEGE